MKPRVINYDSQLAEDAFAVHAALLKAEARDRRLRHNPQWTVIRQDAYERFAVAFQEAK